MRTEQPDPGLKPRAQGRATGSTKLGSTEHSIDSALHASPGPSGSPVTTPHIQSPEKLLMELSEYRYWQMRTMLGRIQSERGLLRVSKDQG